MSKIAVALLLFAINGFGQDCLTYGKPTTLTGTLSLKDEAGYNQFIVLHLIRPICTIADPKDAVAGAADYYRARKNVMEIQPGGYGEPDVDMIRERLNRLIGHRVTVKGWVFPRTTGYHRTDVQLWVQRIDPLDPAGEMALRTVKPPIQFKDVDTYEVTVNAGRRLVIEARESESETILTPPEQYAPHWMTGGEVVYVKCRESYFLTPLSIEQKAEPSSCDQALGCGLNAFPNKPTVLYFRCSKER
jgi:hypothetical protein